MMDIPAEVVPTDVPAWWMLKKKNAMFYNGFGRGDFSRFLMASNLLTVNDTSESREVDARFNDVLAYINSIMPPAYPNPVNKKTRSGRRDFICSELFQMSRQLWQPGKISQSPDSGRRNSNRFPFI